MRMCTLRMRIVVVIIACLQVEGRRTFLHQNPVERRLQEYINSTNTSSQASNFTPPPSPLNNDDTGPASASPGAQNDQDEDWSDARAAARLNLAGRQRMYSQKMAKDALLIYLDTNAQISLWQLEDTRKKFEYVNHALVHGSHQLLIKPATEPDLAAQMDVVQAIWNPFNEVLKAVAHQSNISTDQVMTIVHLEEPLLAELNKFVGLVETLNLEADSARSAEQDADFALKMSAINKAGTQRMRSQKIIVKYAMCVANINYDQSLAALHATVEQFDKVHQGLLEGSEELFLPRATDPKVIFWLGQVSSLWEGAKGFRATVSWEPSMFRLPALVADNIPLLGRYNVLVGLIEQTSSTPPSPISPPSFPSFPPKHSNKNSAAGDVILASSLVSSAVGGIGICMLVYFYHRRTFCRVNVETEKKAVKPLDPKAQKKGSKAKRDGPKSSIKLFQKKLDTQSKSEEE